MNVKTEKYNADDYETVRLDINSLRKDMQGGVSMGGPVDSMLAAWTEEGENACESVQAVVLGNAHTVTHHIAAVIARLIHAHGPQQAQLILQDATHEAVSHYLRAQGPPSVPGDEWKHG